MAEADQASEAALLVERKTAPTVSDSIEAQEMSRMVGSDASDVMQRVTGVSIVDSKYVYIRGLGERYSSTMLNGVVVTSTRPDKKVVPMDLFPAALRQNIRTEKSYTPDQPGELSGGLVKMNTVDFPRSPILKLSYGTSFGSTTTFKDFADYPGGSRDWLGFDDGTRSLPSGIPNQSFNFMAGNTFGKLGVVLALSHGNKSHRQQESRNYYRSAGKGKLSPPAGIRDGLQHPLHPDRHHRQFRLRDHRQQPDPELGLSVGMAHEFQRTAFGQLLLQGLREPH